MQRLVTNSGLFVMQTEFSVYVLLRLWIYLIFHPNWDGSPQDAVMSSHKFFQVKFGFSQKATKFEKIFVVLFVFVFLKTNVAKSYYTNFKGKKT